MFRIFRFRSCLVVNPRFFHTESFTVEDLSSKSSFSDFRISPQTVQALQRNGIQSLFPIQSACFNHIYDSRDLIARAKTGTGKTLSFALPIVERLRSERIERSSNPLALILAPTRELAVQINEEFNKLGKDLSTVCLYGGVSYERQKMALSRGTQIVVGTPGRTVDLLQQNALNLSSVKFLVLDEADRMLDIGFKKELEMLISQVRSFNSSVQTCLFSATVPDWVHRISREYLSKDHVLVDLVGDSCAQTSETLTHYSSICDPKFYSTAVYKILGQFSPKRTIIFSETKAMATLMATKIPRAQPLHGDITQYNREKTLQGFKNGSVDCIVATDVAARGIDVPEVDLVIQLGVPMDLESFIHRAGRTGRAGKTGTCVTLFQSIADLRKIESFIKQKIPLISLYKNSFNLDPLNELLRQIETIKLNESDSEIYDSANNLIEKLGSNETVVRLLKLNRDQKLKSAQKNPISSLTGKLGSVTFKSKESSLKCGKILSFCGLGSTEIFPSVDRSVVLFDLPIENLNTVLKAFSSEDLNIEIVTGQLPILSQYPNNFVNSMASYRRPNSTDRYSQKRRQDSTLRRFENPTFHRSTNRNSDWNW